MSNVMEKIGIRIHAPDSLLFSAWQYSSVMFLGISCAQQNMQVAGERSKENQQKLLNNFPQFVTIHQFRLRSKWFTSYDYKASGNSKK